MRLLLLSLTLVLTMTAKANTCTPVLYLGQLGELSENSATIIPLTNPSEVKTFPINTKACARVGVRFLDREYTELSEAAGDGYSLFFLVHKGCLEKVKVYDPGERLVFVSDRDKCFESKKLFVTNFGTGRSVYVYEDFLNYFSNDRNLRNTASAKIKKKSHRKIKRKNKRKKKKKQ